jgi:hypothetical protein
MAKTANEIQTEGYQKMTTMTASRRFTQANDKANLHTLVEMVPVLTIALVVMLIINSML